MRADDGEVLQGLDDGWTFLGANPIEWASGLAVFLLISLCSDTPARAMPFMLLGWISTTVSLASLRYTFPDQERGVRNALATACGFPPPGIPLPAKLQPVWSGQPARGYNPNSRVVRLGLDQLFPIHQQALLPVEGEED